jgi:hypothetical protein
MHSVNELSFQTARFYAVLSNGIDSEIIALADEILLLLNHLADRAHSDPKLKPLLLSVKDIIYGLESAPAVTLQDQSVRKRLLTLFMKLSSK